MEARALPFILLLISLKFLAACSTPGEDEPIATQSAMAPEQAVVSALVCALLAWKNRHWGTASRLYYTLVTVVAVAFVWSLNYWHLLGWRS